MHLGTSLQLLAGTAPAIKEAWDNLEKEWGPDALPPTFAAAAMARAFGSALPSLSVGEIAAVGNTIEALLREGDERTKSAITTGFLESLLAQASAGTIDFKGIAWMLGPESAKYCRAWDDFSGVKTPGLWEPA